jgi:hypothetical protein
LHRVE